MEVQWKDRNIELSTLADCICQFFTERNFTVSLNNSNTNYVIVVKPRRSHKIAENIRISVKGKPNDFTVDFIAGSHSRALVILGTLTTFLGGGSFSLKGLKSKEALEKLERKFWAYLTEKICRLADSEQILRKTQFSF